MGSSVTAHRNQHRSDDNLIEQHLRDDLDRSIRSDLRRPRPHVRQPMIEFEHPVRGSGATLFKSVSSQSIGLGPLLFILIPMIVSVLLWYSSEPVMELKQSPPAEFAASVRGGQQFWARRYWDCARHIQSRYTYGQALPDSPPLDFRIPEEATVAPQVAAEMRLIYWYQLQKAWPDPGVWEVSRKWRPGSVLNLLQ